MQKNSGFTLLDLVSKKFKKIIEISVEKETNPVNKNSQNRENTYITLDIETDPIWLEFEKEILPIRNETRK